MWQLAFKGGRLMLPILLCSVFALAIIIERIFFYAGMAKYNKAALIAQILDSVRKNKIVPAITLCKSNPFYLTNIIKAGLLHYREPRAVIKEAMEDASLYEIPKLEKNLNFLSTIAHISPLIGLLGTVVGLVNCFYIIQQKSAGAGVVNPSDLAGGIYVALITTVGGLCVAIPSYIAYNYFVHKVNSSVLEVERAATELVNTISHLKRHLNEHRQAVASV